MPVARSSVARYGIGFFAMMGQMPDSTPGATHPGDANTSASFEFDLAFTVDAHERLLTRTDSMAHRILGTTTSLPAALDTVLHAADIAMLQDLEPSITAGQTWTGVLRLRPTALGQRKLQAVVVSDLATNEPRTLSIIATELTQPDQMLAELAHRATHDSLTQLPNRALLFDRLGLALARARRNDRPVALLFMDLDGFKKINDQHGHTIGDQILIDAAHAMSFALRPTDTIARMGGDEFVVLCGEINAAIDAEVIAERIRERLVSITNPSTGEPLSASIGIAVSETGAVDSDAFITAADKTMYEAKAAGAGEIRMCLLNGDGVDISPPPGADAVREALYAGALVITTTPTIDLRTGTVAQVAVTPAWVGATGVRYPAMEFINPGVEPELGAQIDLWSMQAAVNTSVFFTQHCGTRAPRVTTEISLATRLDSDLVHQLDSLVTNAPADVCIGLDLGDQALRAASATPMHVIDDLDAMGVALSARNFGAQPVQIDWLATGAVRLAKIDGSLTANALTAPINTAHGLGLAAVATHLTRTDQVETALYLGCDGASGPIFGTDQNPADTVTHINTRFPIDFW